MPLEEASCAWLSRPSGPLAYHRLRIHISHRIILTKSILLVPDQNGLLPLHDMIIIVLPCISSSEQPIVALHVIFRCTRYSRL